MPPKVGQMNLILIWQAPVVFFRKSHLSLLSNAMIKLQVRVLRLEKMHDYFNVPPYIICTPCITWFRHSTSRIFGLWAFRKYKLLCLSNVYDKENAQLKQNRCIFLYFGVKHFFWPIWLVAISDGSSDIGGQKNTCKFILTNLERIREFRNAVCPADCNRDWWFESSSAELYPDPPFKKFI